MILSNSYLQSETPPNSINFSCVSSVHFPELFCQCGVWYQQLSSPDYMIRGTRCEIYCRFRKKDNLPSNLNGQSAY